jgi:hypothetical protein
MARLAQTLSGGQHPKQIERPMGQPGLSFQGGGFFHPE